MNKKSMLAKIGAIFISTMAVRVGIATATEASHSQGAVSMATVAAQPASVALRELTKAVSGKLTEQQYFVLAKKAITDGYEYGIARSKSGHSVDIVTSKYFAVAGKCYSKALELVQHRLAEGHAVSDADQAGAIARAAWWHFRSADASEYPKIALNLRKAVHLNPTEAIYWAMLAQATWWQKKYPCEIQWAKAVKYLQHAINLDPRCAVAYWMLGQLMISGPRYDVLGMKLPYDLKAASRYDKLCYAHRANFNRFFFYYSETRVRNEIWNVMEALGTVPPNSQPPEEK